MKKIELLSPAGNLEKLKIAIDYGADAVYAGYSHFSLRVKSGKQFNTKSFKEGIDYAHAHGKKLYMTVNGFPFNSQINLLKEHIVEAQKLKPDAFIVASAGVISLCRELVPQMPLHLSTQANVMNYLDALAFKSMGVSRIVAAREISLKDLREIKKQVPDIEIESFIHGSMCFAYSGRCLISSLQSGRVANRGSCANDCRFPYEIYAHNKESNTTFKIEEDEHGTHIMNAKDLNLINHLRDILSSGAVNSLKIEGRTKSPYYVAVTTNAYRRAIDDFYAGRQIDLQRYNNELNGLQSRGYSDAFVVKRPYQRDDVQNLDFSMGMGTHQVCALVTKDSMHFKCKNKLIPNKEYEILSPNGSTVKEIDNEIGKIYKKEDKYCIIFYKIITENGKELESVHSGNLNKIKLPTALPFNSFLRFKI